MCYYVEIDNQYREFMNKNEVVDYVKELAVPFRVYLSQKTKGDYIREESEKGVVICDSSVLMKSYVIPNSKEITNRFKRARFLAKILRLFRK